ncbi:Glutathione S-transferase F12 [Fusarium oxysporum f. sp. albedinis]|nr:Glutathione S-transferase F12 [Fusarium oxysporum f. sp. albedinis]
MPGSTGKPLRKVARRRRRERPSTQFEKERLSFCDRGTTYSLRARYRQTARASTAAGERAMLGWDSEEFKPFVVFR